jgi:hypothetical protein
MILLQRQSSVCHEPAHCLDGREPRQLDVKDTVDVDVASQPREVRTTDHDHHRRCLQTLTQNPLHSFSKGLGIRPDNLPSLMSERRLLIHLRHPDCSEPLPPAHAGTRPTKLDE